MRRALLALVLLALPVAAGAQTPLAAVGQPGWTPAGNDCFVWNRTPGPDETANWSGACVDKHAEGTGTLVWKSPAGEQRYVGEMHDGRLNGHGVYTLSPTSKYEGEFKDDDFDGKGVLTDGGVRYEGGWKYGRKSGAGVLTTPAGDRYEGAFRDDAMTGKGVLVLSDGRKYEGLLQDGRPNGQGTLTEPSGIYTGVWQNGCYSDGHRRAAFGTDPANCH